MSGDAGAPRTPAAGAPTGNTVLRQFLARPRQVGAVRASSPQLGKAIARAVEWPDRGSVVEAGAGDGAVTEELLAHKPDRLKLMAVEVNPVCAEALRRRLPEVHLVVDDLARLPEICAAEELPRPQVVVATLPWSVLAREQQRAALDGVCRALPPDGQFVFFVYLHALPFWSRTAFARAIRERFRSVRRTETIWRNVPPAVVFACRSLRLTEPPAGRG